MAKKSWGLARTVAGVATALSETLTGAGALSEKKAETCRKYSQRLGKSTRGRVAVATTVFVVLFAVGFVAYDDSVGRARTVSILLINRSSAPTSNCFYTGLMFMPSQDCHV